jgi:hypothetical protein
MLRPASSDRLFIAPCAPSFTTHVNFHVGLAVITNISSQCTGTYFVEIQHQRFPSTRVLFDRRSEFYVLPGKVSRLYWAWSTFSDVFVAEALGELAVMHLQDLFGNIVMDISNIAVTCTFHDARDSIVFRIHNSTSIVSAGSVSFSNLVLSVQSTMEARSGVLGETRFIFVCPSLSLQLTINATIQAQRFPSLLRESFVPDASYYLDGLSVLFAFTFVDSNGHIMPFSRSLQASVKYLSLSSNRSIDLDILQHAIIRSSHAIEFRAACIFPLGRSSFEVSSPLFRYQSQPVVLLHGSPSDIVVNCRRNSITEFDIEFYVSDYCGNQIVHSYSFNTSDVFQLFVISSNVHLETVSTTTLSSSGRGYFHASVVAAVSEYFWFEVSHFQLRACRSPMFFHPGTATIHH